MPDEEKPTGVGRAIMVATGAGLGGWAGAGIGIAGAFGAVSGVLPLAVLGAYVGHRVHKWATDEEKRAAETIAEEKARQLSAARASVVAARKTKTPVRSVRATKSPKGTNE